MQKVTDVRMISLLGMLLLVCMPSASWASDYVFPDTMAISATRALESSLMRTADTLTVTVILSNNEPDSLRNLYFADHIPSAFFNIVTTEVQVNGVVMPDTAYLHEVGLNDEVFRGTVPHRWVIEAPPDSLGQRPCSRIIEPITGVLRIIYTARCTTASDHWFPSYTWAGQLSGAESMEAFGYSDSVRISVWDHPPAVVDLATVLAGSDMLLFWSAPWHPAGIDHYVVYRDSFPGFGSLDGDSVGVTADTFYLDQGIDAIGHPGLNVYYLVRAVDPAGKQSGDSNCAGEFDKNLSNVK